MSRRAASEHFALEHLRLPTQSPVAIMCSAGGPSGPPAASKLHRRGRLSLSDECPALCLLLQTVSVAVSVLTLTFISVDRWYAICFPLRFNSTTGRAKTAIAIIWLLALAFDIPELVVLRARGRDWDSVLLTQCEGSWSYDSEMVFHGAKSLLLYTLPLLFMSVAYFQIVRVLWRSDNIPGHDDHNGDVISSKQAGHHATFAPSGSVGSRRVPMAGNSTTEAQLRSRRKAAKMLVAVVAMFAICYLPVHLLNILRYTVDIPQNDTTSAISMLSHWLCYANSAVNPVIYNFMSGKFRAEFRRLFWTCAYGSNRYSPAPGAAPSAAMVARRGGARQRPGGGGAASSAGHEMRSLYRRGPGP
ncbi:orexin receptor type 2-like [Schistocerca serialis cubense]|uniref:orexin receptor type 2-like n=1 Tax=Schistocerca serialis cubense TaxID=2023355 RepID=UPI00214E592B|nr:orexin receptor type 2-like [Schistocerca serialis cubense]